MCRSNYLSITCDVSNTIQYFDLKQAFLPSRRIVDCKNYCAILFDIATDSDSIYVIQKSKANKVIY